MRVVLCEDGMGYAQPQVEVPVPEEAFAPCPTEGCGGRMELWPATEGGPMHVKIDSDDGLARVTVLCDRRCGCPPGSHDFAWREIVWTVTPQVYQAVFGQPMNGPTPPENRELPPGPWGVFGVQPCPIPGEAWSRTCTNEVGRWPVRKKCGAYLTPSPTAANGAAGVFFYDEFTSTATVGYGRCPRCREISLEHYTWQLTPEQHIAIFGRSPGEYRPDYDPDDDTDFVAEYSVWRTADRAYLTHFPNLDELARSEDHDWRAYGPGEYTVKHWPTDAAWDLADFVTQHEQAFTAGDDPDVLYRMWGKDRRDEETFTSLDGVIESAYECYGGDNGVAPGSAHILDVKTGKELDGHDFMLAHRDRVTAVLGDVEV